MSKERITHEEYLELLEGVRKYQTQLAETKGEPCWILSHRMPNAAPIMVFKNEADATAFMVTGEYIKIKAILI